MKLTNIHQFQLLKNFEYEVSFINLFMASKILSKYEKRYSVNFSNQIKFKYVDLTMVPLFSDQKITFQLENHKNNIKQISIVDNQ